MDSKLIDDLMDMELHSIKEICAGLRAMRVLGGWVYETYCDEHLSIAFVPEPKNLADRERVCKIYGHRFVEIANSETQVKISHGINLNDPIVHYVCDKCGKLVKDV